MMNSNNGDCLLNCQAAMCGDGYKQTQGSRTEECDDGNNLDCGTCRAGCGDSAKHSQGSIDTIAASSIYNGEGFTLHDGTSLVTGVRFVYTFSDPPPDSDTLIQIKLESSDASEVVADKTRGAINRPSMKLKITASGAGNRVQLEHDLTGQSNNQPIERYVSSGQFVIDGMSRGTGDGPCGINAGCASHDDCRSGTCNPMTHLCR